MKLWAVRHQMAREQRQERQIGAGERKERKHTTNARSNRDCRGMSNARANRARKTLGRQALRALRGLARTKSEPATIPTLLAAKTQKGMAIPNAAITNPPSAGPAARPILKATPLAAVALSRS